MKRQELEELGLDKETINSVMALYGVSIGDYKDTIESQKATIENQKETIETLETYKEETKGYQEKFDTATKDNEEANREANEWRGKYELATKELEKQKQDSAISQALIGVNAYDINLVKQLIDKDELVFNENGDIKGIEEQVKTLKEDKPFLFTGESDSEEEEAMEEVLSGKKLPNSSTTQSNKEVTLDDLAKDLVSRKPANTSENSRFV